MLEQLLWAGRLIAPVLAPAVVGLLVWAVFASVGAALLLAIVWLGGLFYRRDVRWRRTGRARYGRRFG